MLDSNQERILLNIIDLVVEEKMEESINDKNLFKAIFTAGGAGSGKSFIAKSAFGNQLIPIVNSDTFFELLLNKKGISKKIDPNEKETFKQQMSLRSDAKGLTSKKLYQYLNGMLPLIIDGTGKDFDKIKKQKETLEKIGYDTGMVLVNVDLKTSLARNAKRERSVPEDVVKESWNQIQHNIGKFQDLFGSNFIVIDNDKLLSKEDMIQFKTDLHRRCNKLLTTPLKNQVGRKILATLKDKGGSYLDDVDKNWRDHIINI